MFPLGMHTTAWQGRMEKQAEFRTVEGHSRLAPSTRWHLRFQQLCPVLQRLGQITMLRIFSRMACERSRSGSTSPYLPWNAVDRRGWVVS